MCKLTLRPHVAKTTFSYIVPSCEDSNAKLVANTEIPYHSVVLLEHPCVRSINTPLVQCEVCFHQSEQLFTCLDCRCKTYCTLRCMLRDQPNHQQFECVGYKYLTLLVLDSCSLFSVFVRISSVLHERVFTNKSFRYVFSKSNVFNGVIFYAYFQKTYESSSHI